MHIGLFVHERSIEDLVSAVAAAAEEGFASVWLPQIFGHDALTMAAVAGREVPGIELGTAVVPIYPRHPSMLAAQALTVAEATGQRFTLGIGLSHQPVVEGMWGLSFERPARHMREYLEVLVPLLSEGTVSFTGDVFRVYAQVDVPGADPVPVLVAALGTRMLEIAGTLSAGTVTWMCGPETIGSHIVPTIRRAAEEAGRAEPRVVCVLPVCVTDDPDTERAHVAQAYAAYGFLPSYRAMLDRESAAGPADVAVVGDEAAVSAALADLFDRGVTEFVASPTRRAFDERTVELLASLP